jgi:hypothetical protein
MPPVSETGEVCYSALSDVIAMRIRVPRTVT